MRRTGGILLALATLALLARLAPDLMGAGGESLPVAAFAPAQAHQTAATQEKAESAGDGGGLIPEAEAASPAPQATEAGDAPESGAPDGAWPDDKTLLALRERRKQLESRASALDAREREIRKAEEALRERLRQLEQIEASIRQRLDEEASIKNKKIKRLAAVYAAMKSDRAAPVIAKMELGTVVRIFLLMDEKRVGKILSFLPPDKAVRISQALTRNLSSL